MQPLHDTPVNKVAVNRVEVSPSSPVIIKVTYSALRPSDISPRMGG